jgi:hypothetical protein
MRHGPKISKIYRMHRRELRNAQKRTTGGLSGNSQDRRRQKRAEKSAAFVGSAGTQR